MRYPISQRYHERQLAETSRLEQRAEERAAAASRLARWAFDRWSDGPAGRRAAWRHVSKRLGSLEGHRLMGDLEHLMCGVAAWRLQERGTRGGARQEPANQEPANVDLSILADIAVACAAGSAKKSRAAAYARADQLVGPFHAGELLRRAGAVGARLRRAGDAPTPS